MFLAIKKYPLLFIFALFTAGFLSSLGVWQLERGQDLERANLLNEQNSVKKVLNLNSDEMKGDIENGLKVTMTGHFIPNKTIFHDNRLNSGKSGYHVYSVFSLNDNHSILVNRGWVSMDLDRRILPTVVTDSNEIVLSGTIRFPIKNVYRLEESSITTEFPIRVQTIEIDQLSAITSKKLAEYAVLLDSSVNGEHFERQWENLLPGKYMTANKHYAYSLQWFSLAIVALIIFLTLIYKMARNEQR